MSRLAARAVIFALVALAAVLPAGCGGRLAGPPVCSQARPCAKGFGCVLGRCRNDATIPIASVAPRLVFQPTDLVWLGAAGERSRSDLDAALIFGDEPGRTTTLMLRFAVDLIPAARKKAQTGIADNLDPKPPAAVVQRALLVFAPFERCESHAGQLTIEVARLLEPWSAAQVTPRRLPRMDLPVDAGDYPMAPLQPLRLDITEMVRDWIKNKDGHGIALLVSSSTDGGACFASGFGRGRGPELEVYLAPAPKKRKDGQAPSPPREDDKGTGEDDEQPGAAVHEARP